MKFNFIQKIKKYLDAHPKTKKIVGVILIIVGFFSLITPLTPGAWLAIIGFEFLGLRILFFDRFKFWNKK